MARNGSMLRGFRGWLGALLLAACCVPLLASPSQSPSKPQPDQRQQIAISALSKYLAGSSDAVDRYHAQIGYAPPNQADMVGFPVLRKIELAYVAAESAAPGMGGERYLALMSQALAREYNSAQADNALAPFVSKIATQVGPVPFDYLVLKGPSPRDITNIPSSHRAAIRALSSYLSGGPLGSTESILVRYFGLPIEDAEQLVRTSIANEEVFLRALTTTPSAQRDTILASLTQETIKHYRSAASEPSVRPYLSEAQAREVYGAGYSAHPTGTPEGERSEIKGRLSQLFKQARSKDEQTVARAFDELAQLGDKLDKTHVDQISVFMEKGKRTWATSLGRESHCTWYEYTQARYYAADAMMRIQSPYVTEGMRAEAQKVRGEAKFTARVTDPGWI